LGSIDQSHIIFT